MKWLVCSAFIFVTVIFFSCNQKKEPRPRARNIKVVEAKGSVFPIDSIAVPKVIPVDHHKLHKIPAGNPQVVVTNSNVYTVNKPKVVLAGKPRISTPGTDTFLLPKTIVAIGKIIPAGIPKSTVAKEAAVKDQNPANFSFYKTLQGLKHNYVRCMLQDNRGNLWLGTHGGGVSCYNGKYFTHFTEKEGLASNFVWSILQDKKGNFWFGTHGNGVSKYDGKCFTNYTRKEGLQSNFIWSILQDKTGNLWFGTYDGGVSCYDGKSFTNFTEKEGLANNTVRTILQDVKGSFWFGTDEGVSCYDGKSFVSFTEKEGLPNNRVISILQDKAENIWLGTEGGGVSCYDGKSFTHFTQKEGLTNNIVTSILQDETEKLWFSTAEGISCYDGKSFTRFTENEGLPNNDFYCILQDNSGALWFGSRGGGISLYDGKRFTHFTEKNGLSNDFIMSVFQDHNGNLWFGTDGSGVLRFDGKSFTNFTQKEGLSDNYIMSVFQDNSGVFWFGTRTGGVCRYDGRFFTSYTEKDGLADNTVLSILQDKVGNLWFGTYNGGVSRYDGKTFTNFTQKEGLASNAIMTIVQDKTEKIWFGTSGGGVSRYDGKSFTNYTEKDGLANNTVLSILQDKAGNLWFGTIGAGVSRYNGKSFISFTENEGLVNNAVLSLMEDKQGNIWFGTRMGLSKSIPSKLANLDSINVGYEPIEEGLFYNYNYNDGFLGLNCRRNSVVEDRTGKIWWGTDVLTCYAPKGDITDTKAPIVEIKSVKLFGEEIAWTKLGAISTDSTGTEIITGKSKDTVLGNGVVLHDLEYDGIEKWNFLPQHLSLPYNNNNLSFTFIGVHLQSRNHVKYMFKLEGLDDSWSVISNYNEASYGNLPTGDYTFKVKAMNQSGVWSTPKEFHFTIRPPWWKAWWFRVIAALLFIGSILYYVKWRERTLKLRQKELEIKINQATVVIRNQKEEAEKQKDVVEEQKKIIEQKNEKITDSISYAKHIQDSLLISEAEIKKHLPELFIFYQPKDIVSGDFYWFSNVDNKLVIAVADCTGHGVPGAFLCMIGQILLSEIINDFRITNPGIILDELHLRIKKSLQQKLSTDSIQDGMDISVCVIDKSGRKIEFAGAHNNLYVITESGLEIIKGDSQTIGGRELRKEAEKTKFKTHSIEMGKVESVYILSDGYPDQFGGPERKKFGQLQFKEMISKIAFTEIKKQQEIVRETFENWKGQGVQTDDVLVIGFKTE